MKALFDTNIFMDLYLNRPAFVELSSMAIAQAAYGRAQGFVSAVSVTTIYYTIEKSIGRQDADNAVKKLLSFIKVASVDEKHIKRAASSDHDDFEDAVIYQSALAAGMDCIVTRDKQGFKKSAGLKILTPEQFLAIVG